MEIYKNEDCLETFKGIKEFELDIIFGDPPYALGSELIVKENGKLDYSNATDFMNKWTMPTGEFWEQFFKDSYKSLKYGGYCILFGIDRQSVLFKYYACLAGFKERQSLYWYFIQNFPKATNCNKLGKKYEGYKYSCAPLKQTLETIMVFQKPYKTGSCLKDILKYEEGDKECGCGALNIDENRVETNELTPRNNKVGKNGCLNASGGFVKPHEGGRYPSQLFIDDDAATILDNQAELKQGTIGGISTNSHSELVKLNNSNNFIRTGYKDIGGISKILHKCKYEQDDYDICNYSSKVLSKERNEGIKNTHPTLKPIKLIERILKLFKSPNEQKIFYPFAGSGSEVIGGINANFNDFIATEISKEYFDILIPRVKYFQSKPKEQVKPIKIRKERKLNKKDDMLFNFE